MPGTTSKKKADIVGKKKRSRKDVEDIEQESEDESKPIKKQNTSKTPVRSTTRTEAPYTEPVNPITILNPPIDPSALNTVTATVETLEPPPTGVTEFTPNTASTRSSSKPKSNPVVVKTANGNPVTSKVEESQMDTTSVRPSRRYSGFTLLLVLLLTIVIAAWFYDRLNSELVIGELRQVLQNCNALQSQERMQDEHYIQELETQVRGWKQNSKAKDVEFQALRERCQEP